MKKNIIIYFYAKYSLIYCLLICIVLFIIQNFTDEYIKA